MNKNVNLYNKPNVVICLRLRTRWLIAIRKMFSSILISPTYTTIITTATSVSYLVEVFTISIPTGTAAKTCSPSRNQLLQLTSQLGPNLLLLSKQTFQIICILNSIRADRICSRISSTWVPTSRLTTSTKTKWKCNLKIVSISSTSFLKWVYPTQRQSTTILIWICSLNALSLFIPNTMIP